MEREYFDCPEYVASTQAEVDRAVEFECEVSKMLSELIWIVMYIHLVKTAIWWHDNKQSSQLFIPDFTFASNAWDSDGVIE